MGALGNKQIFSRNLNYYMSINNKTRSDICNDLGFKYSTFSEWANGKKYPRIDKIEMLADYFGIRKSDLIEDKAKGSLKNTGLIGERIRQLRESKGLTQKQLSDIIGVTEQEIQKSENSVVSDVLSEKIEAMAHAFGCSPAYLMGWADSPNIRPSAYDVKIGMSGEPTGEAKRDFDFLKYGLIPMLNDLISRGDLQEISKEKQDGIERIVWALSHLNDDDIKIIREVVERWAGSIDADVTKKNDSLSALLTLKAPLEKEDEK